MISIAYLRKYNAYLDCCVIMSFQELWMGIIKKKTPAGDKNI